MESDRAGDGKAPSTLQRGACMKIVRFAAAAIAAALLLAACTRAGNSNTVGGRNPWTVPGVIRVGNSDEPDSLNPMYGHNDAADQVDGLIYSSLLRYDDSGNYIPDLAREVPSYANGGISKDNLTVTVHMRKDAKWADGVPLTAKDWLFTYHAVLNPANTVKTTLGWDDIASVQTPDDYTLVIHLKKPDASFLGNLAFGGAAYPPLPEHLLAKLPDLNRAEFNAHPLSSGPYIVKEWVHGSQLTFVPNPYYFRGKPAATIDWKIVPDVNTLFNLLQTHQIDVELGVNENDIPRLRQIPGFTVEKKLIANWRHMGINMSKPLLRDQRVRLALAEGVDWKRINDTIYHGYNVLAVSDIFPQSWAAPSIPRYAYDPQHAKQLLAQAGFAMGPDGFMHRAGQVLQLSLSTGTNKQENQVAEVQIQSDLHQIGVDIQIHNYPVNLLFDRAGPLYTGKYDLEWSIDTNGPDPDNACTWASDCIPPHGSNTSWLSDPVVDRTAHAAQETFDIRRRKELYQQEEQRIHELVPAVFFYWEVEYNAVNTDVQNVKPAAFIQDTWNSWEWRTR
jgi:peptide/nickel transport system substrate-binding protein